MKSRVFIISSLLLLSCMAVMACGGWYYVSPQHHWIFYTGYYEDNGQWQKRLNERFREENITFWHHYVGQHVSRDAVEQGLYKEYLLDAHTDNDFFRYLIDHHDTVALQYWQSLKAADPASVKEYRWRKSIWYYKPHPWEISWADTAKDGWVDMSIPKIKELDEQCIQQCKDKNIRNRYLLQLLRKYFYQNDFQNCILLWEKYGKNVPNSALRTQCINYYGGALRRLYRFAESEVAYSEIAYYGSGAYDSKDLQEIYKLQPNCKGFEYMVQQFVNDYFDLPRDEEAKAFNVLVDNIIREKKNNNPALWKSAQAALAYIDQDTERALRLLSEAERLKGSKVVKENIRMMRLLFNSSRTDKDNIYEQLLYPDLKWLTDNIKKDLRKIDRTNWNDFTCKFFQGLYGESISSSSLALHRVKVLRRVIFLGVMPHFERLGRSDKALAYIDLYHNVFQFDEVDDNVGELWHYVDTAKLKTLLSHAQMLRSGGRNQIEKYLIANSSGLSFYYNIIGNKYMWEERYDKAIQYFKKVPSGFQKSQRISKYINSERNPFAEKWITNVKEKGNYNLSFDPVEEYALNPCKITFCRLMLRLRENSIKAETEEERAKSAYAYAVGLYQSSIGYAWALTNFWWRTSYGADYLDQNIDYEKSNENQNIKQAQKRVNTAVEESMKYKKERMFTLKCKILHSNYRALKRDADDSKCRGNFNPEVRHALCDNWGDYEIGENSDMQYDGGDCHSVGAFERDEFIAWVDMLWQNSIWHY